MIVGKHIIRARAAAARKAMFARLVPHSSLVTKLALFLAFAGLIIPFSMPQLLLVDAGSNAQVWWPQDGKHVSGPQPFKAAVEGMDISQYEMFWQVDGGSWVWMDNSSADYPHKEASVDVNNWKWKGSGPYVVNFIARQNGNVIGQQSVTIYVDNGAPSQTAAVAAAPTVATVAPVTVASQATPSASAAPSSISLAGLPSIPTINGTVKKVEAFSATTLAAATPNIPAPTVSVSLSSSEFYVDPGSSAAKQASDWRSARPTDAQKMDTLAAQPTAKWFGGWSGDIQSAVNSYVGAAAAMNKTPVLIAYNIPQRDCGGYSAGGTNDYTNWIGGFARGIGSRKAVVVLEPDALAQVSCLSATDQATRYQLLSSAVSVLKANSNTRVYIDAGHSNWISADTMAVALGKSNISGADGFALNVSNFMATGDESNYGSQISSKLGGKHFVIDTSRNGNGSNGEWCNPSGRKIGTLPTTNTGNPLIDAYLWLKTPGESDGNCNGAPSAGTWWADYALSLVP
jgi:endoglucanase